jgi:hypothetical protein
MFVQDGFLYLIVTRHKLTVYNVNSEQMLLINRNVICYVEGNYKSKYKKLCVCNGAGANLAQINYCTTTVLQ